MDLDDEELEATRKLNGLDTITEEEREYITKENYILTNLSPEGWYCIRIKEGEEEKEYDVWYHKKDRYIKKGDKKIYLDNEVKKYYQASVREYERYGI